MLLVTWLRTGYPVTGYLVTGYLVTGYWFHRESLVAGYWRPGYVLVTRLLVTWFLVVGFAGNFTQQRMHHALCTTR